MSGTQTSDGPFRISCLLSFFFLLFRVYRATMSQVLKTWHPVQSDLVAEPYFRLSACLSLSLRSDRCLQPVIY